MSSGLSRLLVLLLLASSLGGCKSLLKKRESEATSAAPAAAPPPVVTTAAPVAPTPVAAVDDGQVPASQDFEDEAFDKVTAANYKAELARLQAEIDKR